MSRHGGGRPAGRLATARRVLAVCLVVAAVTATATGLLAICEEQVVGGAVREVCRTPRIDDGLTLTFALLLLLLVLPDLSEVGVPGLFSLRGRVDEQESRLEAETAHRESLEQQVRRLRVDVRQATEQVAAQSATQRAGALASTTTTVGGSTVNITLPSGAGTASARLAASEPPDGEEAPAAVTQARYAAAEYLLAHLVDEPPAGLGEAKLNLFLPVDDGTRLLPALTTEQDRPDEDAWRAGEGVVGRAWQAGEPVTARGAEVSVGLETLPEGRRGRYRRLSVVVAVPVLNSAGAPIGVLSAASVDPSSPLDAPDCVAELLTRADVLARVLVDLLGWADDGEAPAEARPTAPALEQGEAEWTP